MNFLKHFYLNTIKYDLVNRFFFKDIKKLPKIKKIILGFGCQNNKSLTSSLLALKLITQQNGLITKTNRSNILLRIRKGNPAGCKVTLRKNQIFKFFYTLLIEILPKLKHFEEISLNNTTQYNTFSYQLNNISRFWKLEKCYFLFHNLPKLDITVVTNTETKKELVFLLKSLKLPLKNK